MRIRIHNRFFGQQQIAANPDAYNQAPLPEPTNALPNPKCHNPRGPLLHIASCHEVKAKA